MQRPDRPWRWRSVATAAVVVVAAVFLAGCGGGRGACTLIGSDNAVGVLMPPSTAKKLSFVHIKVCQDDDCVEATAPGRHPNLRGMTESQVPGADRARRNYSINLNKQYPGAWNADAKTTVVVTATDGDGRTIVRYQDDFTFTKVYPNGAECDRVPFLHHTVTVPASAITQ